MQDLLLLYNKYEIWKHQFVRIENYSTFLARNVFYYLNRGFTNSNTIRVNSVGIIYQDMVYT